MREFLAKFRRIAWRFALAMAVFICATLLPLPAATKAQIREAALAAADTAGVAWMSRQFGARKGRRKRRE